MRNRLLQIEAIAISVGGLILLAEIARAIRVNLSWIDRTVATAPRFSLYLWTAILFAVLLIVKGAIALRSTPKRAFTFVEAPLTLLTSAFAVGIVRGWRIRTDVASIDRMESADGLPLMVRTLASVWWSNGLVVILTAAVLVYFWKAIRTPDIGPSGV